MSNKIVFNLLLCLFVAHCCYGQASAPDIVATVLLTDDPAPVQGSLVAQQSFTGNNPASGCAYYELLQQAKSTAGTLGANVLKINSHRKRTRDQYCEEISVSFYNVTDVRAVERHLSWTPGRRLEWADFKGPVPASAPASTAAITSCGIAIETNTVTGNNPAKVYIFNSFETAKSWVRPDQQKDEILAHEQGHFDLCELYTRKMRAAFAGAGINVDNLREVVQRTYQNIMDEYTARQQRYEQETHHGIETAQQKAWLLRIAAELKVTERWQSV